MAYKRAIRALERASFTGTGDILLSGAVTGYLPFSGQMAAGDTCDYAVERQDRFGFPAAEFEVGTGTFQTGPARIVRTAGGVVNGSAGPGVLVNFTAGPKKVADVVMPQSASAGGMPTGTSPDALFYENDQTVTASYSIAAGKNAMSAGPITIATGQTVTVPTGQVWTIV